MRPCGFILKFVDDIKYFFIRNMSNKKIKLVPIFQVLVWFDYRINWNIFSVLGPIFTKKLLKASTTFFGLSITLLFTLI